MRFSEDRMEKLTCSDGAQRNIHIWEAKTNRAIFLIIHGVMDHAGNYVTTGLFFKEHGITTVAHDQRGHDLSGPDRSKNVYIPRFEVFLDDIELMIAWTKEHYPGFPLFIVGHSMGGLIATHFGIRRLEGDPQIRGFILSSPYYVNKVKASWIVKKSSALLALILPKLTVPLEDFTQYTTRDETIVKRHYQNAHDGVKASRVSVRCGNELLKAQRWVADNIAAWRHPLLAIVAGNDKIADAGANRKLLGKIDRELITEVYYPENYHENFNEPNREEVYARMLAWVEARIS